jgi:hypothetical protein
VSTPLAESLANLSLSLAEAWQDVPCREVARSLDKVEFLAGSKAVAWLQGAILEKRDTVADLSTWSPKDAGDMLLLLTAFLAIPQSPTGLRLHGALMLVFLPLAAGHLGAVPESLYEHLSQMGGA